METKVVFNAHYNFAWLKNTGDSDCYVSVYPGIQAEAENVSYLPKGECTMRTPVNDCIYIEGETVVEVHAQNIPDCPFMGGGSGGGGEATLITKVITSNDTYDASDDDADGYSSVTVNVAQDVEIITRSDWNALTTAQKQAKGLVAIQDASTGYKRGEFVNGADYVELNTYIPYSNNDTVICSAHAENFDATENSWGDGSIPVVYVDNTKKPTFDAIENAVLSNGKEGVVSYVPAGWGNFTAYVVMKAISPSSYASLLCCIDDTSSGHGITLIGGDIYIASYQSDTQTGISSASYFVGAIKYGIGTAGYVYDSANDNVIKVTKNPPPVGGNITIGKMSPTLSNREEAECLVRFLGVTNVEETDAVIEANIRSLYNTFIAGA